MGTTSEPISLDYEEQVGRIRRQREESEKFSVEQRKLSEEAIKLAAEARKLDRDRSLAPYVILAGTVGGAVSGAVIALFTHFLH